MPVVEPVVTIEKLRILLDEGVESGSLDYKATIDLGLRRDQVELAKDVAAMQGSGGGYIAIGVDNTGQPSGALGQEQVPLLDEAAMRAKLVRWIPEPFELLTACHRLGTELVALIYVAPRDGGFPTVLRSNGEYEEPSGRKHSVFRQGEVFMRHGSASERWTQQDWERIRRAVREAEKEEWATGIAPLLQEVAAGGAAQSIARGPLAGLTWRLDAETFRNVYLEQMRSQDLIPLRLFLDEVRRDGRALLLANDPELSTFLDRLTEFAADVMALEQRDWFEQWLRTLVSLYDAADEQKDVRREQLMLAIIQRIMALGGLAVRLEDWASARSLVAQVGSGHDFRRYNNWIRHALTMASRARLFSSTDETGRAVELSMLQLSHRESMRLAAVHRGADEDLVLDSLCQFDMLAGLVAIDMARGDTSDANFYTNFARYYSHRSEPVVRRLIRDDAMRRVVFTQPDDVLAEALRTISSMATHESFRFAGWDGFGDPLIVRFLSEHPGQA